MFRTLQLHHQGEHEIVLHKTHLFFRWLKPDLLGSVSRTWKYAVSTQNTKEDYHTVWGRQDVCERLSRHIP